MFSHSRRVGAILAVAFGAPVVLAQLTLVPQSPTPTGRNLGGVAFTSPSQAFLVGDNHHLIETSDVGESWTTRMATDLSTDPFYTITFPSATHGYLAGNNQDAYRTTDGGRTWIRMNTFPSGSARVLDFVTPTTGFVGLNGALVWTPDGGLTWQNRSVYPDAVITFGMDFRDENVGLIAGIRSTPHHDGGIYRTTDGGRTVTLVSEEGVNDLLWISSTSVLAVGGPFVLRSDDEGLTWYPAAGGIDTGLTSIARAGESDVICGVSGKGDIWQSVDLGFSWVKRVEGIGVLPGNWEISMADANTGMVVGTNGLVYRTTDAGTTWTLLSHGCGDEITDIKFLGENFGYAVTHFGYVFRTRDGGRRWDVQHLQVTGQVFGRSEGLSAVAIIDESNAVVGGAGGMCFRTFDGGDTWQNIGFPNALPAHVNILAITFVDWMTGYITGSFAGETNLYATTNGGASWEPVSGPMGYGVAVDRKGDRIWVSTGGSVVDRSFNAGQTWTRVPVLGDFVALSDMQFADENVGYAVSRYGYIAKTTNGGVSWVTTERGTDENYLSLSVVSAAEVRIMGFGGTPPVHFHLHTTNGGATWTRTNVPLAYAESLSQIHASPAGRVWIAGSFGKILASPVIPFRISLPNNTPASVAPGTEARIVVRITPGAETIVDASATMWFRRLPTAAYEGIPMSALGNNDFEAVVPRLRCSDRPQFYFSAQGSDGTILSLPANAPASVYTTRVGTFDPAGSILNVDFEAGLPGGWTTTGLWHVTSTCPPPAGACGTGARAYYGQDSNCTFNTGARTTGSLTTAPIALPTLLPGQHIDLAYCHRLDTQNPENGLSDYDKAEVWIVHPGGRNPRDLPTDRNLPQVRTAPLDQYAGQSIRVEFKFDSVDALQNAFRGWHVDNVRVTGPVLLCTDLCVADVDNGTFTGTPDGGVTIDDLLYYLSIYAAGSPRADIDDGSATGTVDGGVTIDDLLYFIVRYATGC